MFETLTNVVVRGNLFDAELSGLAKATFAPLNVWA